MAVKAGKNVLDRYIYYFLCLCDLSEFARSTTVPSLRKGDIENLHLPLPPLAEQQRIADKLDVLLRRVDACRVRLARVPAILKRFRQAVLAAATSGRLTEEWREGNGKATDWLSTTFGAAGNVSGGLTKNAGRLKIDFRKPYLRVANVYANRLDLSDVAEIGLTEAEYKKTKLVKDDLLIVEGNGSLDQIGRAAIWTAELPDCVHQNHLIRWRTHGKALPRFALLWLLSPQGRAALIDVASSTTGLHTLSISKVAALAIELPPLDEQHEIVRRVETLFAYADRLEARYAAAREQVEQLTPSLLAKAFRGEMVPQQPGEEGK
jgi:type I restriction enzyme S subunit